MSAAFPRFSAELLLLFPRSHLWVACVPRNHNSVSVAFYVLMSKLRLRPTPCRTVRRIITRRHCICSTDPGAWHPLGSQQVRSFSSLHLCVLSVPSCGARKSLLISSAALPLF